MKLLSLLFLQSLPPVVLGPWGTIILTGFVVLLAFFTWRNRGWKEAAAAAQSNLSSAKETITLRDQTIVALLERCTKAEAKVNLEPLETTVKAWISESRDRFSKAMEELAEIHRNNSANLLVLIEEVRSQRQTSQESFKSLTVALTRHIDEDKIRHDEEQSERHDQMEQVSRILDDIEKRTAATNLALDYIDSGKASRHTEQQKRAGNT